MAQVKIPDGFELVNEPKEQQGITIPEGFEMVNEPRRTSAPLPKGFKLITNERSVSKQQDILQPETPLASIQMQATEQIPSPQLAQQDRPKTGIAAPLLSALTITPPMIAAYQLFGEDSKFGRLTPEQQQKWITKEALKADKDAKKATAEFEHWRQSDETLALKWSRTPLAQMRTKPHLADNVRMIEENIKGGRRRAASKLDKSNQRTAQINSIVAGEQDAPTFGAAKNAVAGGTKAFANAFGEVLPKSVGALQATVTGQSPEETAPYKAGEGFKEFTDSILATDPARQFETGQQVAEGVGQAGSYIAGGASAKGLQFGAKGTTAAMAALGATQTGVSGLDDAINLDATDTEKLQSFYLNAGIGLTEALPLTRLLGRLNKSSGGKITAILKNAGSTGSEEALQEIGQTLGSNLIAKELAGYDEGRDLLDGVAQSAKVGGIVGMLLGAGGGAVSSRPERIGPWGPKSGQFEGVEQNTTHEAPQTPIESLTPSQATTQPETQTANSNNNIEVPDGFVLDNSNAPQVTATERAVNAGLKKSAFNRVLKRVKSPNIEQVQTPIKNLPPIPDGFVLETGAHSNKGGRVRPQQGIPANDGAVGGSHQNAIGLHEVTSRLNTALGLTARQGRVASKNASGTYNLRTGVIRTRKSYRAEIDTFSHEGGHALEFKSGKAFRDMLVNHSGELNPMAYEGANPKHLLSEGFAEFFRTYVTNPQYAQKNAPQFYNAFESNLQSTQPQLFTDLRTTQSEYQKFLDAPSAASISADIVSNNKGGKFGSGLARLKDEGVGGTASSLAHDAYTMFVDKAHPFTRTVRALQQISEANTGRKISLKTTNDPAKLLRLAMDANSSGHMDLMHGVRPYQQTQAEGASLSDAIKTALGSKAKWSKTELADFGAYLVARRATHEWERYKRGEIPNAPTKHTKGDNQQAIKDFETANPEWKNAASMVYEFTQNLWKKKYDAGLITTAQYEAGKYIKDYVPLRRDMDDKELFSSISNAGRTGKQSVVKKFKGSQRAIINPMESLMQDAYETAQTIARNDVLKALDKLAQAAGPGAGALVERIPATEMQGSRVDVAQAIEKAALQNGMDKQEAQQLKARLLDAFDGDAMATLFSVGTLNERGEPIVYMWDKGERIPLRIGDKKNALDIYSVFTGLNQEQKNIFVDAASLPTTLLRHGITTSPDFLFANYIRDQLSAWILTDVGFKPFFDGAKGTWQEMSQADVTRLYNSMGGIMGGQNVAALNVGEVNKNLKALRQKGLKVKRFASWKGFAALSEVTETGTRLALFARFIKDAKERGLSDYEAAIEAAYESRDYIDFGRHGSKMLSVKKLATFMNAAIQGTDKGIRTATNDGRLIRKAMPYLAYKLTGKGKPATPQQARRMKIAAKAWAKMSAIGALGLGLTALYQDDPEYEEFNDYTRATHWMVKDPNGQWYAIPKPFELAFLSNIFERAFEAQVKDDPLAYDRLREGLGYLFLPPHNVPAAALPIEQFSNKKFYNGGPIVPSYMKALEPHMQHSAYASDFALRLGKQLNWSPARIDHVVNGVFGSWGRNILSASNNLNPKRPAMDASTTPIARRFAKSPTTGAQSRELFYDLVYGTDGSWNRKAKTLKRYLGESDGRAAEKYLAEMTNPERQWALLKGQPASEVKKLSANGSKSAADIKRMHPMQRAQDAQGVVTKIRKELITGDLMDNTGKGVSMNRQQKREFTNVLAELNVAYARNALILSGAHGWTSKTSIDEAAILARIQKQHPLAYGVLSQRLNKKKVSPTKQVVPNWNALKSRLDAMEHGNKGLDNE